MPTDLRTAQHAQTKVEQIDLALETLGTRLLNLEERVDTWVRGHQHASHEQAKRLAGKLDAMEAHLYALDAKIRRLEA